MIDVYVYVYARMWFSKMEFLYLLPLMYLTSIFFFEVYNSHAVLHADSLIFHHIPYM